MKDIYAYRVDFEYLVKDQASLYIVAATPEDASAGALIMLNKSGAQYDNPTITKVEEYNPQSADNPTLN